jgi:hypothetical protein
MLTCIFYIFIAVMYGHRYMENAAITVLSCLQTIPELTLPLANRSRWPSYYDTAAQHNADHSTQFRVNVKNLRIYTSCGFLTAGPVRSGIYHRGPMPPEGKKTIRSLETLRYSKRRWAMPKIPERTIKWRNLNNIQASVTFCPPAWTLTLNRFIPYMKRAI